LNVLGSAIDEFTSIQNGLGVLEKSLKEQRHLVKRMVRSRAKHQILGRDFTAIELILMKVTIRL
jgi:hypothetical protein